MTKTKTILVAMVLAFAAPAAANEHEHEGPYAGVGGALVTFDCPSGFTCGEDTDTVPLVYAGGMFSKHFGAELGYLPKSEFKFNQGQDVSGTLEYSTLYAGGIGRLPLDDNFAIYGKLGANFASTTAKATNGTINASVFEANTSAFFGAGAEASFGNLAARLDYTRLHSDVGVGSLSILYRF